VHWKGRTVHRPNVVEKYRPCPQSTGKQAPVESMKKALLTQDVQVSLDKAYKQVSGMHRTPWKR